MYLSVALVPCTSGSSRGRGVDKRTFSPIPFHTQKIRVSGAGPRNLLVKILQSEAENVPFKANVWDWTGIDVSGGSLKPNLSEFVQRQTSGSRRLSFSLWQDLVLSLLVARLQDEEINKCKELGKALQPGWERSSYSSHPGSLQVTLQSSLSPSYGGGGAFNRPDQSPAHFTPRCSPARK